MKWHILVTVEVILPICMGISICTDDQPKSKIMDILSGITRTSRDVIMGTVKRVHNILPQGDMMYPDDSVIYELFEYFKDKMNYAHPKLKIPVLEPFQTEYMSADIENDILGNLSVYLQNVNITGISKFDINKVKMNWMQRKLDIDLNFKNIAANGTYRISGLLGNMIPIHGIGPARLGIKDLNCKATAYLGTNNFVYIKAITLNYTVNEIQVNLENLMGGGRLGELLNKVLNEEGLRILDLVRTDVTQFVEDWLSYSGNEILEKICITMNGVLDFLKTVGRKKVQSMFNFSPFKSEL